MHVEQATGSDIGRLVATLVESHLDYAWEAWAVVGADRPVRLAEAFRTDLELLALPYGVVTKANECEAVAVWLPAGAGDRLTREIHEHRERIALRIFSDRLDVVEEVEGIVGSAPCPESDWHLATMGTRPAHQRRGLGSAVLRPMLDQLDRDRQSARLETSIIGNVRFYERHGFDVVTELELPHGAPTTWIMHRRPEAVPEAV